MLNSKDLTILVGAPGMLFRQGWEYRPIWRNILQRLGIDAIVAEGALNLISFNNKDDLHLFVVSGTVVGPIGTAYYGYQVYEYECI